MRRANTAKKKQISRIIGYVICMLYITLFSRTPTLTRITHMVPLWSYTSQGHAKQILLNAALFIPFGYFLSSALIRPHRVLLLALVSSISVELLQFLSYRGMADVDDLISNVAGAAAGLGICKVSSHYGWRRIGSAAMMSAGLVGCFMTFFSTANRSKEIKIAQQFDFRIDSVDISNNKLILSGICSLYDRKTPDYRIFIGGREAPTDVTGERFIASTTAPEDKVEVQVKFRGFPAIRTGIWVNRSAVEYVPGDILEITGVPEAAVLKSYNSQHDVLIYQDGNRLLWLIGDPDIDRNTEIIYHIHTTEKDRLPERRIQYGFDNRGFRVKADEQAENELPGIDHYRVFYREIPQEYYVTAVVVGFSTDGAITWNDSFRIR